MERYEIWADGLDRLNIDFRVWDQEDNPYKDKLKLMLQPEEGGSLDAQELKPDREGRGRVILLPCDDQRRACPKEVKLKILHPESLSDPIISSPKIHLRPTAEKPPDAGPPDAELEEPEDQG